MSELEDTVRRLELKSSDAEERLRDLQHTRLALEKEIDVKRNSLAIDRDRCLKVIVHIHKSIRKLVQLANKMVHCQPTRMM